jgi:hypothetical protein
MDKNNCENTDRKFLVSPNVFSLHVIDEGAVYDPVPTRRGIVAGEIPVSGIGRTCFMQ